ncbi:RsmB/NOP family class I SAM-dependent RNA methyltransferase [Tateyamaria sp. SN6-1]|uniref:RsmB/NOP family class I SAM-dependent RNA methyltransferase n=1 Tax=Tateyamaria sp. SN6-1 TaxID=3092148 RepID=UPI0039F5AD1F
MTPGARVAAAIEIIDRIVDGTPAEQALTRWARGSRFAGSKDRAAIRDHVFDHLRHWRSDAVRGGGTSGRARMIGRLRGAGVDPSTMFDGQGHAPAALTDAERSAGSVPQERGDAVDLPDWLLPHFDVSLGGDADAAARALQDRAPVTLRVNTAIADVETVAGTLSAEGIETVPNPRATTALTVKTGARRVRLSNAYETGAVELQDAASQVAMAEVTGQGRALDFCAGGGGKALALAARGWDVTAHDADAERMRDLPARAARGTHRIAICTPDMVQGLTEFDVVLCDAPCSGAGTWRRAPEAKWRLTPKRLQSLVDLQADILDTAVDHVAPGGALYYATCSILNVENFQQIERFVERHPAWRCDEMWHWPVDGWGDGFFMARLLRA